MADPAPVVVVPKKRGCGCFGCGCAILVVILLLALGLAVFGSKSLYHTASGFAGTEPVTIVPIDRGPAVFDAARLKLDAFEQAFYQEQPATLRLSGDEINTLIARNPDWAAVRGHLLVTLQGQTANLQGSMPLNAMENVVFTDRYLNANATFGLSFDPDSHGLIFDIEQITLNDQALPTSSNSTLGQLLNTMINQKLQDNQIARDFLARVKKAGIENGELVIETK